MSGEADVELHSLRFARALVATNLKASFALRGAFWLQAGLMTANNLLFFAFWWIFFERFEEVRGWRVADLAALYGLVAMGFGSAVLLAGGLRELSRLIVEGGLDPFLTQPKDLLLHVVASKTSASGWGDLFSGALLLGYSGLVHWQTLPLCALAVAASTTVFVATGIVLHSAAFWLGRIETLARMMWEFLIAFSTYPRPIFTGAMKWMLFTVVPAGFIGFLPVELLRDFQWSGLAAVVGGAAAYAWLARAIFSAGLRRYESGNRFSLRAY
jgi:ABC-2 type transport system permease protein